MLDLARHIIDTKRGKFQPERFEDRYDDTLAALVKAKSEGKAIPKPKPQEAAKPIDLMKRWQERRCQGQGQGARQARGFPAQGRLTWRSRPPAPRHRKAGGTNHRGHGRLSTALEIGRRAGELGRHRSPQSPVPATSGCAVHVEDHRSTMPTEGDIPKGRSRSGKMIVSTTATHGAPG